jgi:hypothetical protein
MLRTCVLTVLSETDSSPAVLISGALCAAGGLLAAITITNPAREHSQDDAAISEQYLHCGLDAPPLATTRG